MVTLLRFARTLEVKLFSKIDSSSSGKQNLSLFRYSPPVESVATATSVFTEYVFCESVDSAHNSQISSTCQEADCLLKLVKVNTQVFAITVLHRNLNH